SDFSPLNGHICEKMEIYELDEAMRRDLRRFRWSTSLTVLLYSWYNEDLRFTRVGICFAV
ncbi:uncharacterized, partial [Tachysurus ichikawai]